MYKVTDRQSVVACNFRILFFSTKEHLAPSYRLTFKPLGGVKVKRFSLFWGGASAPSSHSLFRPLGGLNMEWCFCPAWCLGGAALRRSGVLPKPAQVSWCIAKQCPRAGLRGRAKTPKMAVWKGRPPCARGAGTRAVFTPFGSGGDPPPLFPRYPMVKPLGRVAIGYV